MKKFRLLATTAFGTEGITKKEVKKLGFENISVENGKVFFDSDKEGIVKANLWLRTASKIYWVIGEFESLSFSDLYDKVYDLPWEKIFNKNASFPVNAKSVKSTLFSLPSIQSISKKAIVDRLKDKLHVDVLDESEEEYEILVDILKDKVTIRINTTGEGLFKRGYRIEKNDAPMRETLAATLVDISNWNSKIPLVDPMCGTGTILIEAALKGNNIAPGLYRKFEFEKWPFMKEEFVEEERNIARSQILENELIIKGYDIDEEVIEIAKANAIRAGVSEYIDFEVRDLKNFESDINYGYIISNPPYGERLGTYDEAKYINDLFGKIFMELDNWSMYIFTAFEEFETVFKKKATKNRKMYNGKLKCYFYQYYGKRPPKKRQ
ncbi:class I SAM-dependent RNA methyltransferase [Clostridiaceae bacterium HSG29]|nr:class I SAM-dependent RNA methyltransferase [Clostridiaceae bacterium HSG29]